MNDLLTRLRSDWRYAAAVSTPVAAGVVARLLDGALDLLESRGQLDEASLTMAIDVVCDTVEVRSDERTSLRERLVQAAHDFSSAMGVRDYPQQEGGTPAFDSEESLAAALFAAGRGEGERAGELDDVQAQSRTAPKQINPKKLKKSLLKPYRKHPLRAALRIGIVLVLIAGGVYYIIKNPPSLFNGIVIVQPTSPTVDSGERTGTLSPQGTSCPGGQVVHSGAACSWGVAIPKPGTYEWSIRWDTSDQLSITVESQESGTFSTPATTGTGSATVLAALPSSGAYNIVVSVGSLQHPVHVIVTPGSP